MNLSQIKSLVRDFISQESTSNTDFSDTELTGYINQGVRFLGALVKQPRDLIEVQVEAGKPSYTLPSDAIIIRTAYFGDTSLTGDVRPLTALTEEALKEVVPSWLSQVESDRGRPQRIILQDRRTVLVNPTPSTSESASGKKIRIGYVYQPAILVNDSDEPDLPIVYHDFVGEYAYYLCCIGKLNLYEKGVSILNTLIDKAKKFENLIVKDTEAGFGFSWGRTIDPSDDAIVTVNP